MNISVISWQSVLLVEETGGPWENHRPVASHWQTLSHNVVHLALIEIVLALTIDKNNAYILGIGWLCSLSKNTQLLLHSFVFIFYKYVSCFLKYFSLKKYKTIILTQELSNLNFILDMFPLILVGVCIGRTFLTRGEPNCDAWTLLFITNINF
jgi:hypothetical protein